MDGAVRMLRKDSVMEADYEQACKMCMVELLRSDPISSTRK